MPYNRNNYKCPKCRRMLGQYTKTFSGNQYRCENCGEVWEIVNRTAFEKMMGRL